MLDFSYPFANCEHFRLPQVDCQQPSSSVPTTLLLLLFFSMAARYTPPRSLSQRSIASNEDNPAAATAEENNAPRSVPNSIANMSSHILSGSKDESSHHNTASHNHHNNHHQHPQSLPTPSKSASPLPSNLLPSAPASPPTPAPSPTPGSEWQNSFGGSRSGELDDVEDDEALLLKAQIYFSSLGSVRKQKFLVDILNLCDNQQLSFISSLISPRLRKDPFAAFPNEICLRVGLTTIERFLILFSHTDWKPSAGGFQLIRFCLLSMSPKL